jgi:predicted GNAT family N-acyltransferase
MFLVDDKNDNSQSVPVTPTKKRIQSASEDDKHMESLITACQEQEALYEKLYLEYGLVVYKEDYDRDGVKRVSCKALRQA